MKNKWLKMILFAAIGAIAGYGYYYFIGCNTGSCAITSNPYYSTAYGLLAGLFISWNSKKTKKDTPEE